MTESPSSASFTVIAQIESSRSANAFVKTFGMCCTMRIPGASAGILVNTVCIACVPPVEAPIANIMFVSVKERTREIGVRKALGATRGKILGQFLIESMLITASGGIVGLLVSTAASFAINAFLFPAAMSFSVAFMAIALSAGVGLIAGLAPARKGAQLDPIEALRYE